MLRESQTAQTLHRVLGEFNCSIALLNDKSVPTAAHNHSNKMIW